MDFLQTMAAAESRRIRRYLRDNRKPGSDPSLLPENPPPLVPPPSTDSNSLRSSFLNSNPSALAASLLNSPPDASYQSIGHQGLMQLHMPSPYADVAWFQTNPARMHRFMPWPYGVEGHSLDEATAATWTSVPPSARAVTSPQRTQHPFSRYQPSLNEPCRIRPPSEHLAARPPFTSSSSLTHLQASPVTRNLSTGGLNQRLPAHAFDNIGPEGAPFYRPAIHPSMLLPAPSMSPRGQEQPPLIEVLPLLAECNAVSTSTSLKRKWGGFSNASCLHPSLRDHESGVPTLSERLETKRSWLSLPNAPERDTYLSRASRKTPRLLSDVFVEVLVEQQKQQQHQLRRRHSMVELATSSSTTLEALEEEKKVRVNTPPPLENVHSCEVLSEGPKSEKEECKKFRLFGVELSTSD